MFNAFAGVYGSATYNQNETISPCQWQKGWLLSRLPLFTSFFVKPNTVNQQTYAHYNKDDAYRQGQFFEEVAGKTDGENVLAQVAVNLGDKFIDHIFADGHSNALLVNNEIGAIRGDYDQSVGGNRINRGIQHLINYQITRTMSRDLCGS